MEVVSKTMRDNADEWRTEFKNCQNGILRPETKKNIKVIFMKW